MQQEWDTYKGPQIYLNTRNCINHWLARDMRSVSKVSYLTTVGHSKKYQHLKAELVNSHEARIFRHYAHVLSSPMIDAISCVKTYLWFRVYAYKPGPAKCTCERETRGLTYDTSITRQEGWEPHRALSWCSFNLVSKWIYGFIIANWDEYLLYAISLAETLWQSVALSSR